jgi:hypothetical protein
MNHFVKITNFIFLLVLLSACVYELPDYWVIINNKTKQDILIEIHYDRIEFVGNWGGRSFIPYLKSLGYGREMIKFDTINLIQLFKVSKNTPFVLAFRPGKKPSYQEYKKINIFSSDTITLDNPEKIEKAMLNVKKGKWEMDIKK